MPSWFKSNVRERETRMLEIRVSGETATGKTAKLMEMAEHELYRGGNVLYVAPYLKEAFNVVRVYFEKKSVSPNFTSSVNFHNAVIGKHYSLIIFDDFNNFHPNPPEGSYFALANNRLKHLNFGTLAYSTTEIENETWVSAAAWYKPWTWFSGYWLKR